MDVLLEHQQNLVVPVDTVNVRRFTAFPCVFGGVLDSAVGGFESVCAPIACSSRRRPWTAGSNPAG